MKPKYANVVLVRHPRVDKIFVFRVFEGKELTVGDYVLCETSLGPGQMGKCITPSFVIGEWQLKEFYGVKSIKDLKPVTHVLAPIAIPIQREEEE